MTTPIRILQTVERTPHRADRLGEPEHDILKYIGTLQPTEGHDGSVLDLSDTQPFFHIDILLRS